MTNNRGLPPIFAVSRFLRRHPTADRRRIQRHFKVGYQDSIRLLAQAQAAIDTPHHRRNQS